MYTTRSQVEPLTVFVYKTSNACAGRIRFHINENSFQAAASTRCVARLKSPSSLVSSLLCIVCTSASPRLTIQWQVTSPSVLKICICLSYLGYTKTSLQRDCRYVSAMRYLFGVYSPRRPQRSDRSTHCLFIAMTESSKASRDCWKVCLRHPNNAYYAGRCCLFGVSSGDIFDGASHGSWDSSLNSTR